jgi:hypothetical protein
MLSCGRMSIVGIARGSQLQRLQSWSHRGLRRIRAGVRLSLRRRSEQLAEAVTENVASLGSLLADPELLRWSATLTHSAITLYGRALDAEHLRAQLGSRLHRWVEGGHPLRDAWSQAIALTGTVRKRTTAASPLERKPSPELTRPTVAPAFVCDRALVDSMLL